MAAHFSGGDCSRGDQRDADWSEGDPEHSRASVKERMRKANRKPVRGGKLGNDHRETLSVMRVQSRCNPNERAASETSSSVLCVNNEETKPIRRPDAETSSSASELDSLVLCRTAQTLFTSNPPPT